MTPEIGQDLAEEARSRDKEVMLHEILWLDRYVREQQEMIADARSRQEDLIRRWVEEGYSKAELDQEREAEAPDEQ